MSSTKSKDVVARSFGSFHSSNIETQLKVAETDEYVPPDFPVDLPDFAQYQKVAPEFGKPMKRKHFFLDDSLVFLNHGAFGAALKDGIKVAQGVQCYVEAQPVRFIDRELFPQIVHTQKRLAKYIGCKPSDFAMTENATLGTNSVLNSLELNDESIIYHLNTVYGAVKKSMDKVCQRTGAKMQMETLNFPLESKNDIIELVKQTLKPNTALALFSHIPSNTPFVMPVKELVDICHERNVPVLIDGAHALGTVHLNLTEIDADYYILNTHKWFCSPKGCAALYVKPEHQAKIGALSVSHGYKSGFHSEHTFPGLRDYSPILALHCCLNFFNAIGPEVIMSRNHSLLVDAVQLLATAWKSSTLAPLDMHNFSDYFAINDQSGTVTMVKSIDRETTESLSLLIKTTQVDDPDKSDLCLLVVDIADVNDNQPIATLEAERVTVDENSAPGTYVTRIIAQDLDQSTEFRYVISPSGVLAVKQDTGEVVVTNNSLLDAEVATQMIFQVHVEESNTAEQLKSDVRNLTLNIRDLNDNSPTFSVHDLNVVVKENATLASIIAKLNASDVDVYESNNLLMYSLVGDERLFTVSETGDVTLADNLDAESEQTYSFVVTVTDPSARRDFCLVNVDVEDVNEQPPVFAQPVYLANVSRSSIPGSLVIVLSAIDADISDHTVSYTFASTENEMPFELIARDGLAEIRTRDLLINGTDKYLLVVEASDGQLTSFTTVNITVQETNQNTPTFNATHFYFEIDENQPANTSVGVVQAMGSEFDSDYDIVYELCSPNRQFHLHPTSGTLYTAEPLDREEASAHALCVYASSITSVETRFSRPVQVTISVRDLNDNAPVLQRSDWLAQYHVTEETPGAVVMKLETQDDDSLQNSNMFFRLSDDFNGTFNLDPESGVLSIEHSIDADLTYVDDVYNLTVQTVDADDHRLYDEANVVVVVDDIDDNPPQFNQSTYEVSIPENLPVGSRVLTVLALDADRTAINRRNHFRIDGDTFAIEPQTGEIRLLRKLNYDPPEVDRVLTATVFLTDQPNSTNLTSQMTSSAYVTVRIYDVNDNLPVFRHVNETTEDGVQLWSVDRDEPVTLYELKVPEDANVGDLGVRLSVEDKDSGEAGKIVFHTSSGDIVVADNGSLTLQRSLDYESATGTSWFVVNATDQGNPHLSSKCIVSLQVLNTNDHPPKCEKAHYDFLVDADLGFPTTIGSLACDDADGDELNYTTVEGVQSNIDGPSQHRIIIDPTSGLLTIQDPVDFNKFSFICSVSDGRHVINITVNVTTASTNQNPQIVKDFYDVTFPEDLAPGSFLLEVKTTGSGLFQLKLPNSLFEIDPHTGDLHLKPEKSLDFEASKTHDVFVEFIAGNVSSTVLVRINVINVNDNPPKFGQTFYEAEIPENLPEGHYVTQILAVDEDKEDSEIVYGIDSEMVQINSSTGVVTTLTNFDREQQAFYSFTVFASDRNYTDNATLRVKILDENDNKPKFNCTKKEIEVLFTGSRQLIYKALAADDDDGLRGTSWYRLQNNTEVFQINWLSGELFMTDHVTDTEYNVTIEARDLDTTLKLRPILPPPDDVMVLRIFVFGVTLDNKTIPLETTTPPTLETTTWSTATSQIVTAQPMSSPTNHYYFTTPEPKSTTIMPSTTTDNMSSIGSTEAFHIYTTTEVPGMTQTDKPDPTYTTSSPQLAPTTSPSDILNAEVPDTNVTFRDAHTTANLVLPTVKTTMAAEFTSINPKETQWQTTANPVEGKKRGSRFVQKVYHVQIKESVPPSTLLTTLDLNFHQPDAVFTIVMSSADLFTFKSFRSSDLMTTGYLTGETCYELLVRIDNLCESGEFDQATVIINTSFPRFPVEMRSMDLGMMSDWPVQHTITTNLLHHSGLRKTHVALKQNPSEKIFPMKFRFTDMASANFDLNIFFPEPHNILYAQYGFPGNSSQHDIAKSLNTCLESTDTKDSVSVVPVSRISRSDKEVALIGYDRDRQMLDGSTLLQILESHCSKLTSSSGVTSFSLSQPTDDVNRSEHDLYLLVPLIVVSLFLFILVSSVAVYFIKRKSGSLMKETLTPKQQPGCLYLSNSLQRHTNTDSDLDDDVSTLSRPISKRMKRHLEGSSGKGEGKYKKTSPVERKLEQRTCLPAMSTFSRAAKQRANILPDMEHKTPTGTDFNSSNGTPRMSGNLAQNPEDRNAPPSGRKLLDCKTSAATVPNLVSDSIGEIPSKVSLDSACCDVTPVTDIDAIFVDYDIEALPLPERSTAF